MYPVTFVVLHFSLPFPAAHFKVLYRQSLLFLFQHFSAALVAPRGAGTLCSTNTGGSLVPWNSPWDGASPSLPRWREDRKVRAPFMKESKAQPGSFPKPLHRELHLLNFSVAAYQTLGETLHGPAPPHSVCHCHPFIFTLSLSPVHPCTDSGKMRLFPSSHQQLLLLINVLFCPHTLMHFRLIRLVTTHP